MTLKIAILVVLGACNELFLEALAILANVIVYSKHSYYLVDIDCFDRNWSLNYISNTYPVQLWLTE